MKVAKQLLSIVQANVMHVAADHSDRSLVLAIFKLLIASAAYDSIRMSTSSEVFPMLRRYLRAPGSQTLATLRTSAAVSQQSLDSSLLVE